MVQDFAAEIIQKGNLSEAELLRLRRMVGQDFVIDPIEAELLFQINDTVETPKPWNSYFITVITSYLIDQGQPKGYVTQEQATWLRSRIDHDGVVETVTELGLLLNLITQASNVTDELERFTLQQVGQAVIAGKGYLGQNRKLEPGVIGAVEVELLRKVLYGVSSEGGISISRSEAEFLFELNEATSGANHHQDWQRLFVQGLANHLMMVAAWEEPDIQEAIRRENWLEDSEAGIGKFSDVGIKDVVREFKAFFGKRDEPSEFTHMNQEKVAQAEKITLDEASWLIEKLNRDGRLDDNERALLDFLAEECPNIHASLINYMQAA